jgi:hypothetical protein
MNTAAAALFGAGRIGESIAKAQAYAAFAPFLALLHDFCHCQSFPNHSSRMN